MARYPLSLPKKLKQEAERLASDQGVSLNQFILWAVAEKVGALSQSFDDPEFPLVTYRRGAAGAPTPYLRGKGVRVQTVVVAANYWGMSPDEIAEQWDVRVDQVRDALAYYAVHKIEIDANIAAEEAMEAARG